MLVLTRPRIVLLAVPKTGSTAIETALRPHATMFITSPPHLKHMTLGFYHARIAPLLGAAAEGLETAAMIREPVDWLGSWYRYRLRPQLEGHANSTRGMGFDDFVRAYLSDEPPPFAAVGRQAGMLRGGGRQVDHLIRYEAPGALARLLTERGLKAFPEVSRLNVSPQAETPLPEALLRRLRAALAEDFALWEGAQT